MGILGRISRRFMRREGEEVGSGEKESLYGPGHEISGGEEATRPEPEEKPVPAGKSPACGPWQVGDVIRTDAGGAYEVREIKGGGMGQVYICVQQEDRTSTVLKTFQGKYLGNKAAVDRFRWEAEVWVRLGLNQHIVNAYRIDSALGHTFVELEYVVGDEYYGSDLSGWIRKGGLSRYGLALDFAMQFCTGMIHVREVFDRDPALKPPFVHRDIKPQNIMVTQDRVVKITDFGLVKAFALLEGEIEAEVEDEWGQRRHSFTKKGGVCGTLPYIAPEIWRGEEPDERADIYSFGCTLYEMFSGSPPFAYSPYDPERREKYRHAHLNLSPKLIPGIPGEINALVLRCLEKELERRYQDFESLMNALADCKREVETKPFIEKEWVENGVVHMQSSIEIYLFKATAISVLDWDAANRKGAGLANLGFHQEAIECYNQSLKLNPRYVNAYVNRGLIYSKLGQHKRAITDYDEALRLDPSCACAYNNRGIAYCYLGQYKQAIIDYDEASRLDPSNFRAYLNRGIAYCYLGRHKRAIADYDEALRLDPSCACAYNNRDYVYQDLHGYENALLKYDYAILLDTTGEMYLNRGAAYYSLGRYEWAIADFDEALRLNPSLLEAYGFKGKALRKMKRYREAWRTFKRTLEVAQDMPEFEMKKKLKELLKGIRRNRWRSRGKIVSAQAKVIVEDKEK